MRDVDVFWHYQMARNGCAITTAADRRFDFTTVLCETPDTFMVRIMEDA